MMHHVTDIIRHMTRYTRRIIVICFIADVALIALLIWANKAHSDHMSNPRFVSDPGHG